MKQITRSADVTERLRRSFGPDAQLDNLVVFEAIAANLLPLRKSGSIYKGARFSESMLFEMAAYLANESVPLYAQHETFELPFGRVFAGRVQDEQLFVQFTVDTAVAPGIAAQINSGTVDQVSVGVLPSRLLCSECGFDYMGEAADYDNFYSATCDKGHVVGENGVHVRLAGLQSFLETSLVGKGAVRGARIIGPTESAFTQGVGQRLAASAVPHRVVLLAAVADLQTPTGAKNVDLTQLVAQLTERGTQLALSQGEVTALNARITTLEAENATLRQATEGRVDAAQLTAATEVLRSIARRTLIACGDQDPQLPESVTELSTLIEERQARLTALIPTGGKSEPADRTTTAAARPNLAAFRSPTR